MVSLGLSSHCNDSYTIWYSTIRRQDSCRTQLVRSIYWLMIIYFMATSQSYADWNLQIEYRYSRTYCFNSQKVTVLIATLIKSSKINWFFIHSIVLIYQELTTTSPTGQLHNYNNCNILLLLKVSPFIDKDKKKSFR